MAMVLKRMNEAQMFTTAFSVSGETSGQIVVFGLDVWTTPLRAMLQIVDTR